MQDTRPAGGDKRSGARPRLIVLGGALLVGVALAACGTVTSVPPSDLASVTSRAPSRAYGAVVAQSVTGIVAVAPDPSGGAPWGMRTSKTTRGLSCIQIGRVASGQLGVLGQDGAFANDGRFHPLPPQVIENPADCGPPDALGRSRLIARAVGRTGLNVSSQGVPASDYPFGCSPSGDREAHPDPPICPAADERAIFAGTLGRSAKSMTYSTPEGPRTINLGPDGAYLIVTRANPQLDQGGANVSGVLPPPGDGQPILRITYSDGLVCNVEGVKETDAAGRPCVPTDAAERTIAALAGVTIGR